MTIRQTWQRLKYRDAPVVRHRTELERALAETPAYIVVEGTEALRAYAATLAYRGGVEAAELEAAAASQAEPAYMMVPTVGRITDGYRVRARPRRRRRLTRLRSGMGSLLVVGGGVLAALFVEWLSFPSSNPELVRGHRHAGAQLLLKGAETKLPTHAPGPPPLTLHALALEAAVALLVVLAVAALVYAGWLAAGIGREMRVSWRVENRIQGRLVIARVRTPAG